MKYAKLSCLIVLLLVSFVFLFSCADQSEQPDEGTLPDEGTEEPTEPEEQDYLTQIPIYDFGGTAFRIAANDQPDRPNIHSGEIEGDIINDSMVKRDMKVEEMFTTTVEYIGYEDRSLLVSDLERTITAGEDFCELVIVPPAAGLNSLIVNGRALDLAPIQSLDLSAEWWSAAMVESVTHNGKTYATAGPMALCYCYSPYAFFVNLNMLEDRSLGNVYEYVRNGEWTLDTMATMIEGVSADLNNNGKMDAKDQYGLATTAESGKAFYIGCGQRMAVKTQDGAELLMDSEESVEVIMYLNEIMSSEDSLCIDGAGPGAVSTSEGKIALFLESRAMFAALPLQWGVLNFRGMTDDYTILPYPKYNEYQGEYYSHMNSYFPYGIVVPITNSCNEETGAVMEALAYLSQTTVLPNVNEVVLKGKVARDAASKEMIDMLFENVIIDLNAIFDFAGTGTLLRETAVGEKDNFVSSYNSLKTAAETEVEEMILAFENIE